MLHLKFVVWFNNPIVVPRNDEIRQQILDEAHLSRYSIHHGSTKMYHDLKHHYWWTKMKIEIARYVAKCDTCRHVKAIHMKTAGPLQSLPIPTWKSSIARRPRLTSTRKSMFGKMPEHTSPTITSSTNLTPWLIYLRLT